MKKLYVTPEIAEIGNVHALTTGAGTSTRVDLNELTGRQETGSFDICDGNPDNNPPGDIFCIQD